METAKRLNLDTLSSLNMFDLSSLGPFIYVSLYFFIPLFSGKLKPPNVTGNDALNMFLRRFGRTLAHRKVFWGEILTDQTLRRV